MTATGRGPGRSRSASSGPRRRWRSTSTTERASPIRPSYLRVESPSAEVQGHAPSQKVTLGGKRHVGISTLEPVGNYAVRLLFDDGHEHRHLLLVLSATGSAASRTRSGGPISTRWQAKGLSR